jgi:hypothetical protein
MSSIPVCLWVTFIVASTPDSVGVTVVVSGETHAMLLPCDCPNDPGGGLAERASALKKFGSANELLLLDAGGFAAGGIYDDYTGGRAIDSQRTLATLRAMGSMGYDAAAIGDDELQFGGAWLAAAAASGGVPLVSANCFLSDKKPLAPLYRIVVKNGIRFAITAVAAQERLFPRDESCTIAPPVASVRKIWKRMTDSSDCQIILSHLGEELTQALADTFPHCAIMVNGHRKTSQSPAITKGSTLIMQFGYQGKKLSFAALKFPRTSPVPTIEKTGWIGVARGTAPDSAVARLLAPARDGEARQIYDLYIMGQCPYGIAALKEFTAFVKKFPAVEWHVWFIGSIERDSLLSLHGPQELRDEMSWLAVKALYPQRWLDFLSGCSGGAATDSVLIALKLDRARIAAWVRDHGFAAVKDHYLRSTRLAISASPTLLINNAPFEKPVESRRLVKVACGSLKQKEALCDSLPECFEDSDCRKKGAIGSCSGSGKCEFTPDAQVIFSALIADSTIQHPEKNVVATTGELFPNATIEVVPLSSKKGQALMASYAPASLPWYLFEGSVVTAHSWSRIESGLVKVKGGFTFKNGITPTNYFPLRPKKIGAAALFIDPLFPDGAAAVRAVTVDSQLAKRIRIFPSIFADPQAPSGAVEEKARSEEALRWLVLDSLFRSRYAGYLVATMKDPGSSYWFRHLAEIGLSQDTFMLRLQSYRGLLQAHWRLLTSLGIKEPVTMLLENRQIVVLRSEADLARTLEALRQGAQK